MAKKRTEQKTKSFSQAIGLQYIFNNTITDFFLGLALVTISVVTIIAMVLFEYGRGRSKYSGRNANGRMDQQ